MGMKPYLYILLVLVIIVVTYLLFFGYTSTLQPYLTLLGTGTGSTDLCDPFQDEEGETCDPCHNRTRPDGESNEYDTCIQDVSGKVCGTEGHTKKCCDWVENPDSGEDECACNTPFENPCGDDPARCVACMAYAEAGGTQTTGSGDSCITGAICTMFGDWKNNQDIDSLCDAVSDYSGDAARYTPYNCVCNKDMRQDDGGNEGYCRCCTGDMSEEEQESFDHVQDLVNQFMADPDAFCSEGIPTGFTSGGRVPGGCTRMYPQCTQTTYYNCP